MKVVFQFRDLDTLFSPPRKSKTIPDISVITYLMVCIPTNTMISHKPYTPTKVYLDNRNKNSISRKFGIRPFLFFHMPDLRFVNLAFVSQVHIQFLQVYKPFDGIKNPLHLVHLHLK